MGEIGNINQVMRKIRFKRPNRKQIIRIFLLLATTQKIIDIKYTSFTTKKMLIVATGLFGLIIFRMAGYNVDWVATSGSAATSGPFR